LTGRFTSAEALDPTCSYRARYLASLARTLDAFPWQSVILGSAWESGWLSRGYQTADAGNRHIASDGDLGVAYCVGAILGGLVVRGLQFFSRAAGLAGMPLLVGLACALFYAWLTGMQPPALRTCVALICVVGLRLSAKRWSSWQIWLCCIGAILFADPLAVLSDSLWLSIFAVAALIFWYQWRRCGCVALAMAQRLALGHLQLG
jgi:competence protein ComEC